MPRSRLLRHLAEVQARDLEQVGGKAANLGELLRAGFPVPDGFVLTTAAYALAAAAAGVDPDDPTAASRRLQAVVVPEDIAAGAVQTYAELGRGPVAVRSSATAEDLPGASFAGQQDTFLNVVGEEALLDAIRRCWASLWNERAVAYRSANHIDPRSVRLAVVIQKMVEASTAGVLFTADPLTGRRTASVVDAVSGLGEKLVSGAMNPDHFVVDRLSSRVLERPSSGAAAVLSDTELQQLRKLGERVEQHFGSPQDIEFALDADRRVWLVQSRPITTLYPLPTPTPQAQWDLGVYLSANVFQGYFAPLTPMGIEFFRLLGTGVYRAFGASVEDPASGPSGLLEAGMRLFIDVTPVMRDPAGQRAFTSILSAGEARSAAILRGLRDDPRVRMQHTPPVATMVRVARALLRVGVPRAALQMLLEPLRTRRQFEREIEALARIELPSHADSTDRLDAVERLLLEATPRILPRLLGIMAPAMLTLGLTHVLLRGVARPEELQTLTRGAPRNPTTQMDLALWALSTTLGSDSASRTALLESEPPSLAAAYRTGELPRVFQSGLSEFLAMYGFRSIGEIDIGVKRWSEDPTHIIGALANYARLSNASQAPDVQFARAEQAAEAMLSELVGRVRGPRRLLARWVLRRLRMLIGGREAPKFQIIRVLATPARELLRSVGADLSARGVLDSPDDIFFLTLAEARTALKGGDARGKVAERRQIFQREEARRHIPRVLLSDGTDAEVAFAQTAPGVADAHTLRGTPASPGAVSGTARVIASPSGARLEPGEILVAPSTDPGWTPLFLTAGGLVMEMGGMMSHGAVVAREYGIPAVVGVTGATERIHTGQQVTVDGAAGSVEIVPPRLT